MDQMRVDNAWGNFAFLSSRHESGAIRFSNSARCRYVFCLGSDHLIKLQFMWSASGFIRSLPCIACGTALCGKQCNVTKKRSNLYSCSVSIYTFLPLFCTFLYEQFQKMIHSSYYLVRNGSIKCSKHCLPINLLYA